MRDSQRNKEYTWEREIIEPRDQHLVPFDQIQTIVNYVWEGEGLKHPPRVEQFRPNVVTKGGDATRLVIRFPSRGTRTHDILHEVAHSLNMTFDDSHYDEVAGHGPEFVGILCRLLEKHLKIPMPYLLYTASKYKLKVNPLAKILVDQ